jgi:predicted ATPase
MIESVRIRNFKCLSNVTARLHPLTVLIGKNDTGKSSFLDAMFRLGRLVVGDAQRSFVGPWAVDRLLTRSPAGARSLIHWQVTLAPSNRCGLTRRAEYGVGIGAPRDEVQALYVDEEKLSVDGREDIEVGYRTSEPAPNVSTTLSRDVAYVCEGSARHEVHGGVRGSPALSIAGRQSEFPTIRAVARSLTSTVRYRFDPAKLAEIAAFDVDPDHPDQEPRLGDDGTGLPMVLDYLLGSDRTAFDRIETELHAAVPFVSKIRVKPAVKRTADGKTQSAKSVAFQVGDHGQEIAAPLMSDGVLLFLAYLTLLHGPSSPALMLLEEPENGVHPKQLERIAELLLRLTDASPTGAGDRAAQVIVATHSPYLLDFVPPECVLVFGRLPNGTTVIKPLLELPQAKERLDKGFSLGELWFNVGEDRLLAGFLNEEIVA